ncbi:ribosome biogenesis protein [Grosmannia clavigera kw1407]|uniref:Ribosome biogenesis protein n=1 Tax=Grosmannia clavigera (strain kw1407 / UAMH 11150) TaxID=655863 RepID=F0XR53_GROCL|nr:ribosome biogenesis protein [Grosmannia clavigera kw1407]EFX00014.1 ribosome biogenesis protein [Grosmannia clavigera kw1407]
MPAASQAPVKRKRAVQGEAPRKRSRSESGSGDDDDDEPSGQGRILLLEQAIVESKKNYNNIVLANKKTAGEKDRVVVGWLRSRLAEYEDVLLAMLGRTGEQAATALTLVMRLVQAEGEHLQGGEKPEEDKDSKANKGTKGDKPHYFPQALFRRLVGCLVHARQQLGVEAGEALADEFVDRFAGSFHDVRFYTFRAVTALLQQHHGHQQKQTGTDTVEAALYLLSLLDAVPEEPLEDGPEHFYVRQPSSQLRSLAQHKKQAQDAWIALLSSSTTAASTIIRKRALALMEPVIAPWFVRPELLLDYLTDCYNAGGATSLLALSGLYYLIRERNVDYPAFYTKLYSLLDGDMLHSKHRSRFFRLMDTFLASTHLPAQLVASFVKRLARLCLHAPPSAIVSVVPWIYNSFRKHPLCTFMIHRVPADQHARDRLARDGLADPFRPDESDPMETRAIESCLWEIVQLQSHYHPNVATIAKIISEQFTKQTYNLEDFLDHSYQSLFDAEIGKEVKKTPVVEFQIPKRIFFPQDPAAGLEDGLLVKLWDFS